MRCDAMRFPAFRSRFLKQPAELRQPGQAPQKIYLTFDESQGCFKNATETANAILIIY
jgi:hypothetical protein